MKKLIFPKLSCFVILISLLLTGCGGSAGAPVSVLESVKNADVLVVGVKADVPRFGYLNPDSKAYEGFEVDLAGILAEKILGDSTKLVLKPVNSKTRGPLLDKGDVDIVIATFTITEERKISYDFSEPYLTDAVGFLVKKDSGITLIADMDGKDIAVAQGATSRAALEKVVQEQGVALKFSEFATYAETKSALDAGRVQVVTADKTILKGYLDESTMILEESYAPQTYGIATKKGNAELVALINQTIEEMRKSGEFKELLNKWELEEHE